MIAGNVTDAASIEKAQRLQQWGFLWVVIGFLVLLQVLFGSNPLVIALMIILVGIAGPPATHQASRIRDLLEYACCVVVFIVLVYGTMRLGKALNLNTGLVLSATSLFFGVSLQTWAQVLQRSRPRSNDAVSTLIDKIRHL